tara:strand:- start:351 stop:566 length:216 start_codon:yes stop_codon:yes gene_type:complete
MSINPGRMYMPVALISLPSLLRTGLLDSSIATPGYPTTLIAVILSFSTVISTGPIGGAPLPFMSIAPRIIS